MLNSFIDKLRGAKRSLTLWINGLFIAMLPFADQLIAMLTPLMEEIATTLPQLQPYLPDNMYKAVGAAAVVINMILRFKTRQPLEHK